MAERVLILERDDIDLLWYPAGDYEVIAETDTYYKVKCLFGGKWIPKDGGLTKCFPVRRPE